MKVDVVKYRKQIGEDEFRYITIYFLSLKGRMPFSKRKTIAKRTLKMFGDLVAPGEGEFEKYYETEFEWRKPFWLKRFPSRYDSYPLVRAEWDGYELTLYFASA